MRNNIIFICYLIYALILITGFMWAIIYKDLSEWWILLLLCLLSVKIKIKN